MNTADSQLLAHTDDALARLEDSPTIDDWGNAFNFVELVEQWAKSRKDRLKTMAIEHIKATGQDIVLGPIRYYVGVVRTYKTPNPREAIEILLDVTVGDIDKFSACLSSGWLKHGTVRKLLEEAGQADKFASIFAVDEREKLEEGKPMKEKTLLKFDERFQR